MESVARLRKMQRGMSALLYVFRSADPKLRNARKLPKNNIQDFYIQSTVDFIENHYMNEISVEDMAANLGLNRSYFSKSLKRPHRKAPGTF